MLLYGSSGILESETEICRLVWFFGQLGYWVSQVFFARETELHLICCTSHMLMVPTTSSCSPEVLWALTRRRRGRREGVGSFGPLSQVNKSLRTWWISIVEIICRSSSGPKRREVALETHLPRLVWYRILNKPASPCMGEKMYGLFLPPFPIPGRYWYWVLSYPSGLAIGFKTGTFDEYGASIIVYTRVGWVYWLYMYWPGKVTVVPKWIWHKLNYFSFCRVFEKLFSICAEISIKSKVQLSGLNHKPSSTILRTT